MNSPPHPARTKTTQAVARRRRNQEKAHAAVCVLLQLHRSEWSVKPVKNLGWRCPSTSGLGNIADPLSVSLENAEHPVLRCQRLEGGSQRGTQIGGSRAMSDQDRQHWRSFSHNRTWTWRAHSTHSGATSWHNNGDPATVPNGGSERGYWGVGGASQQSRYDLLDGRLHCMFIHRHPWSECPLLPLVVRPGHVGDRAGSKT
jgi:hypothetical protein